LQALEWVHGAHVSQRRLASVKPGGELSNGVHCISECARNDQRMTRAHPIEPARWPTREEAARSVLFSPFARGALSTRTRTWVPAMVPWRATEDGCVTRDVVDWYRRFAEGRPGVLVVEATGVRDVPSGPLLRAGDARFVPGLRELVRAVRDASGGATRLFVQLIDFLAVKRRPERAKFVRRFLVLRREHREGLEALGRVTEARATDADVREALLALPHAELLALLDAREREALEFGARERVTDVHLEHVRRLPETLPKLFAGAALHAREAGFDGVELHFAHAYTMASFLSRTNDRTDGYGGTRAARARLPLEVYAAVRAAVGGDCVVGCRFLGDEVIDGGSRIDDAADYGVRFARAGFDFLSISKGGKFDDAAQPDVGEAVYPYTGPSGHECMPTVRIDECGALGARGPFGRNLPLSAAIRGAVRAAGYDTPVVGAGGINSFELAEHALRSGACDFVGAARQSLADPDWWAKMESGRGAAIRRCKFTNYCEALDQRHRQVTCQLWDRELDAPMPWPGRELSRSSDGKRRLVAPPDQS
jgi:2,4-dienoyl-CoA reductase-like NADH-dependent reductase (Old Yellow Enzyme family)